MPKEPVSRAVPAPLEDTLAALREILPAAFSEGRVDCDKLREAIGDTVGSGQERYSFTWAGKQDSARLLQVPSRASLSPAPEESLGFDSTGNDFIYRDDFSDPLGQYLELTSQVDAEGNLLTSNPEMSGRYHSAWLSMMYPRLFVARQLLRDDGVIFVSIDDHEAANLRLLLNDVFGEENFIATVIWQKVYAPKNTAHHFSEDHDYVLVYARNAEIWRPRLLPRSAEADARYINPDSDPRGPWKPDNLLARNYYSRGSYVVESPSGEEHRNPTGTYWRVSLEKFRDLDQDNRVWWGEHGSNMPALKRELLPNPVDRPF